jgi:DNA-directed RNA polymerase specialized sigma54-like protein
MKKPTKDQIAAEIAALKKLKPVGPFARKTAELIAVALDALNGQVDETAEEFEELTEYQRDVYYTARNWLNGEAWQKPSEDWDGLCA